MFFFIIIAFVTSGKVIGIYIDALLILAAVTAFFADSSGQLNQNDYCILKIDFPKFKYNLFKMSWRKNWLIFIK